MMLQKVERDSSARIQGDDLAVYKRAGREAFARLRNVRELLCEDVSSPGPERHLGAIPPGKAAITVELDLVEPFLALGKPLNQPRIDRINKPEFGGRERAEVFGSHKE